MVSILKATWALDYLYVPGTPGAEFIHLRLVSSLLTGGAFL